MNELKRLVLDFRTDEFVIRTLYRTEGGSTTREDVLLATASPDADKLVKGA
jgi:hypothetical protein